MAHAARVACCHRYANRARNIKNQPVKNVRQEHESQIEALREQVKVREHVADEAAARTPPSSNRAWGGAPSYLDVVIDTGTTG